MLPLRHIRHKKVRSLPKKHKVGLFDNFIYLVAFAGPIMTIPQIYDIWIRRSTSVNVLTWGSYLAIGFIWLIYGLIHKEKPIIFSNILGIVTTGLVFLGAVIYK